MYPVSHEYGKFIPHLYSFLNNVALMRCPYRESVSFFTTITQKMIHQLTVMVYDSFFLSTHPNSLPEKAQGRTVKMLKRFLYHHYFMTLIIWWSWKEIVLSKVLVTSTNQLFSLFTSSLYNTHFHLTIDYFSQLSFRLCINL